MSIRMAFLGTGTCNSTSRNPSATALSDGSDVVLIDCGGGSYHQMSRLEDGYFRYNSISTVLLTHFHVDHVAGLADLIWGGMWDSRGRRTAPLTIAGPPGVERFISTRLIPFIGDYKIPFEIKPVEIQAGETFSAPFFTARSCRLAHDDASTGYLLRTGTKKIAVTGDTGFCDNLVALLSEADIAVMEWSRSERSDFAGHLSGSDIEKLVKLGALPPEIFITHMYLSPGHSLVDRARENKEFLGENIHRFIFPEDLDVVDIEN
jgi:ribonuclease BN (tRNA processing enzyme)